MAKTHVNIVYIIIGLRLLTATFTLLHSDSSLKTMLRVLHANCSGCSCKKQCVFLSSWLIAFLAFIWVTANHVLG